MDIVTRLREWRRGVRGQAITPTDALMEEAADEIERLRETTTRLNRRSQLYESGLAEKAKRPDSSLGRALANAAATMYAEKLERAEAVVEVADEFYTRLLVAHAAGEFEMPPRLAPFAEALGEAFDAYDKE